MISISPHLTQRHHSWTAWKSILSVKGGAHQFDDDGTIYLVWFYDGPEVHLCTIWKGQVPDGIVAGYGQEQNDADRADFEAKYKARSNKPLAPTDSRKLSRVVIEKADTAKVTFFSHDWCDKTTWYEAAPLVENEVATDTGDRLTFGVAHTHLIDTYHGRITGEDFLKDAAGKSYRVAVKVDGATKSEQNPHTGTGGDYVVDYVAGEITFFAEQTGVVTVTYHYAAGSVFTIRPATGKQLSIELVECQFSMDVEIADTIKFQAYGYVDAFAPQYLQSNGGPYPPGTLIPLGNPTTYKGMRDYVNEAVRSYVQYPPIGGAGWRGIGFPTLIFDWDYARSTVLRSSMGMEVRITLEHNTPFGGSMATATFYAATESE